MSYVNRWTLTQEKKIFLFLFIFSIIFFSFSFFDIITFFSPAMFIFTIVGLGTFIYGIILIVTSIVKIIKNRDKRDILRLLLGVWAVSIMSISGTVSAYGLIYKIESHEAMLITECEKILKSTPPDINIWNNKFDLWASLKHTGRKSISHYNGIVYINIQGSPDNEGGFAYNPKHKKYDTRKKMEYFKPMFGGWYRYDFSY